MERERPEEMRGPRMDLVGVGSGSAGEERMLDPTQLQAAGRWESWREGLSLEEWRGGEVERWSRGGGGG